MTQMVEKTFNSIKYGLEFHVGKDNIPVYGYPHHMMLNSEMIRAVWNDDVENAESIPILVTNELNTEFKLVWIFINGLLSDETLYSIVDSDYKGYNRDRLRYLVEWFAIGRTSRFYRYVAGIYRNGLDVLVDMYPTNDWNTGLVCKEVHLDIILQHRNTEIDENICDRPDMTLSALQKLKDRINPDHYDEFVRRLARNSNVAISSIIHLNEVHGAPISYRSDASEWVRRNPDWPWCWKTLSGHADMKLVWEFPDRDWDWRILSSRDELDTLLVEAYPERKWDWFTLSLSEKMPIEFIMRTLNCMPWRRYAISCNPQVTMAIVRDNPEVEWDYDCLSSAPLITWQDVLDNPDEPWDYDAFVRRGILEAYPRADYKLDSIKYLSQTASIDLICANSHLLWHTGILANRSELFPQLLEVVMFTEREMIDIAGHCNATLDIIKPLVKKISHYYIVNNRNMTWEFALKHCREHEFATYIFKAMLERIPLTEEAADQLPKHFDYEKYQNSYYKWEDIRDIPNVSPSIVSRNPNVTWRHFRDNPHLVCKCVNGTKMTESLL